MPRLCGMAEEKFAALPHGPRAQAEAARYRGGDLRLTEDHEQVHVTYGFPGVANTDPDYLRRAGLCDGAGRRHVLAPVPGSAREARALLFGLCLRPFLHRWRAVSASMPARAKTKRANCRPSSPARWRRSPRPPAPRKSRAPRRSCRSGLLMGLERPVGPRRTDCRPASGLWPRAADRRNHRQARRGG